MALRKIDRTDLLELLLTGKKVRGKHFAKGVYIYYDSRKEQPFRLVNDCGDNAIQDFGILHVNDMWEEWEEYLQKAYLVVYEDLCGHVVKFRVSNAHYLNETDFKNRNSKPSVNYKFINLIKESEKLV